MVTVSIGVAAARCTHERSIDLWISTADTMLYQAKEAGRNQVISHLIEAPDEGTDFFGSNQVA
ncbi:diguanylate cyclase [Paracoccus amoyensis]|uniref:diguanylate cyclase n=1 Tax=Paracoccus amoyensis TaxID=2760093 RepID=UPI003CCD3FC5